MVAPSEAVERRNQPDEAQRRRDLVYAYFSYLDPREWQGMTQDDLVGCVETLHQRLSSFNPQKLRDPRVLEELKAEYTAELPVLGREIEGLGMSVYELLLNIAKGMENFALPPLVINRPVSPKEIIHLN